MKTTIIISSKVLNDKCNKLFKVLNAKATLPALENIIFNGANNILTMIAGDGENFIQTSITLEKETNISFSLEAKTLVQALKDIPEQPLKLVISEVDCTIHYSNGHFRLPLANCSDYPNLPTIQDSSVITLAENTLCNLIAKSVAFTSNNDLRPVMTGLCFKSNDNVLQVAASTGHVLSRITINCACDNNFEFILNHKVAKIISSMLKKEGDATIEYNNNYVVVKTDEYVIFGRLLEGKYPNFNAVIPAEREDYIEFERNTVAAAIRRVSVFANGDSLLIAWNIRNMNLTLKGEDVDYSCGAEESVTIDAQGKNTIIGLKANITQDILSTLQDEQIRMDYLNPSSAVVFKPVEVNPEFSQLILQMPMLLAE